MKGIAAFLVSALLPVLAYALSVDSDPTMTSEANSGGKSGVGFTWNSTSDPKDTWVYGEITGVDWGKANAESEREFCWNITGLLPSELGHWDVTFVGYGEALVNADPAQESEFGYWAKAESMMVLDYRDHADFEVLAEAEIFSPEDTDYSKCIFQTGSVPSNPAGASRHQADGREFHGNAPLVVVLCRN